MIESATNYRVLTPRATLTGLGDSLANLLVAPLPEGALCWVIAEASLWRLAKSSLAAVGPTVIATSKGVGVPGRWIEYGAGGDAEPPTILAANASGPFDFPISGDFGEPPGMSVTFDASLAGQEFIISAWAEITNGDLVNPHSWNAALLLNNDIVTPIIATALSELAAGGTVLAHMQYLHVLVADDPSPTFTPGYQADGAGPDLILGCISVIRNPPP